MHQNNLINSGWVALTALDATQINVIGILCTTAGNAVITDSLGVSTTIPMLAGQTITGKIVCLKTASTGVYFGMVA